MENILSTYFCFCYYLFIFICFFCAKKKKKIEKKKKKKLCYVFVKFELNYDCDVHFIGLLKGLNISLCQ
jgi:hypothetical protein